MGARSRQAENTSFPCAHCATLVPANTDGHYRNHCPWCLWSLHVDELPGDRASTCHGLLVPVGVEQSGKKGWIIVHRCARCGHEGRNRAALDDGGQPDDWNVLVSLSTPPRP